MDRCPRYAYTRPTPQIPAVCGCPSTIGSPDHRGSEAKRLTRTARNCRGMSCQSMTLKGLQSIKTSYFTNLLCSGNRQLFMSTTWLNAVADGSEKSSILQHTISASMICLQDLKICRGHTCVPQVDSMTEISGALPHAPSFSLGMLA